MHPSFIDFLLQNCAKMLNGWLYSWLTVDWRLTDGWLTVDCDCLPGKFILHSLAFNWRSSGQLAAGCMLFSCCICVSIRPYVHPPSVRPLVRSSVCPASKKHVSFPNPFTNLVNFALSCWGGASGRPAGHFKKARFLLKSFWIFL